MTRIHTLALSWLAVGIAMPTAARAHDTLVGHAHPHAHVADGFLPGIVMLAMLSVGFAAIIAKRCVKARRRR